MLYIPRIEFRETFEKIFLIINELKDVLASYYKQRELLERDWQRHIEKSSREWRKRLL
jgi:hypothetical protein